jgi:hypothetical protein
MKRIVLGLAVTVMAVSGAACFQFGSSVSPSNPASILGGTWSTTQSLPGVSGSIQDSCVNFRWAVTEFTGTAGAGTFSATCLGNIQVSGSARGTLSGTTVTWSADATGTVPGLPPCAISLSGTATLEAGNRIRIPYSGTTCLGPVSGTEVISR